MLQIEKMTISSEAIRVSMLQFFFASNLIYCFKPTLQENNTAGFEASQITEEFKRWTKRTARQNKFGEKRFLQKYVGT